MPQADKTDVQWILDALAADRTKTRKALGEAIGIDKSGVTRLLNGGRTLKFSESRKIARYLGVARPGGFSEEATPFAAAPPAAMAPVYRASAELTDPPGWWRLHRKEPQIDSKPKAPQFAAATRVFGLYAQDDAMTPRFKAGELFFVDPARPVSPGDDVLFTQKAPQGGFEKCILGELLRASPAQYFFLQHASGGEQRISAKSWIPNYVLRAL